MRSSDWREHRSEFELADLVLRDNDGVPIYRTGADGTIVDVNTALVELLGYPDFESLARRNVAGIYSDPEARERFVEAAEQSESAISFEQELIHFSGRSVWVRDCARAVRDGSGAVIGFEGALLDITAQKRAIQSLEYSEKRYRNLFEWSPIALWEEDFSALSAWLHDLRQRGVTDLRRYFESNPDELTRGIDLIRIVDVNRAAVQLVEAGDRDQLLGRLPAELLIPSGLEAFTEQMVAIWAGEKRLSISIRGQTFTGRALHCRLEWIVPPTDQGLDTSRIVVAIVDATEQETARRELERVVESRDRFISSASHHLRTPLTVVMGYSGEMAARWDEIDPTQRRSYVETIAEQTSELADLIENLLVAARSDTGGLTILPEQIDLAEMVEMVAAGTGHPISLELTPAPVRADPTRVRQILRNLIGNALEHGASPIEVLTSRSERSASVIVRDAGAGVGDDEVDDLFERYQGAHDDSPRPGPLGIGLTVSRVLARLMGGEVTYLRSGESTEFSLTLPVSPGT